MIDSRSWGISIFFSAKGSQTSSFNNGTKLKNIDALLLILIERYGFLDRFFGKNQQASLSEDAGRQLPIPALKQVLAQQFLFSWTSTRRINTNTCTHSYAQDGYKSTQQQ